MAQAEQLLAFAAGGRRYGVPAAQVRAIAGMPAVTPVPHAPDCLIGLANVRGESTPVIALSRLLDRPEGAHRRLLVIESAGRYALAVDHVEGVVGLDDVLEQPPVDTLLSEVFPERRTLAGGGAKAGHDTDAKREDDHLALLGFTIGDQRFAFQLDQVEHVANLPDAIARFPKGAAAALGTITYRDGIVPLLSLAALLAITSGDGLHGRVLIIRIGQHRIGLLVDAVDRVVRAPAARIDPVPVALLRGDAEAVIAAIYRPIEGGRLISILAADQLLSPEMTGRLGASAQQTPGPAVRAAVDTEPLLLVQVGRHRLGFPLALIDAVERAPEQVTSLPGVPAFLSGIGRLRGEACPIIDLAVHFGETSDAAARGAILMCNLAGASTGLKVDSVIGIVHASADRLLEARSFGSDRTRPFERTLALEDGQHFALILSVDALFGQLETELLRSVQRTSAERT